LANNIYASGASGGAVIGTGSYSTVWVAADIFNGLCRRAGGTWVDEGYNVGSNGSCLGRARSDVGHGANRLGPLAYHGAQTMTILPLKGNPAIDAIPYRVTVTLDRRPVALCPATDERGVPTTSRRRCNAGAVRSPG
jgi:hypothetical protein